MQGFFDQNASLEVAFLPRGNIDDFACTRIPSRGLGLGVLDSQDAESPDFDPIALDKAFPHRLEESIYNLVGQLLFHAQFLRNSEGEVLFGCSHTFPGLGGSQKDGG